MTSPQQKHSWTDRGATVQQVCLLWQNSFSCSGAILQSGSSELSGWWGLTKCGPLLQMTLGNPVPVCFWHPLPPRRELDKRTLCSLNVGLLSVCRGRAEAWTHTQRRRMIRIHVPGQVTTKIQTRTSGHFYIHFDLLCSGEIGCRLVCVQSKKTTGQQVLCNQVVFFSNKLCAYFFFMTDFLYVFL